MGEPAQDRELVAPRLRGAVRHQGLRVPAEDPGRAFEGGEAGEALFEGLVGGHAVSGPVSSRRMRGGIQPACSISSSSQRSSACDSSVSACASMAEALSKRAGSRA